MNRQAQKEGYIDTGYRESKMIYFFGIRKIYGKCDFAVPLML
jgi:hypothetical protein